MRLTHFLNDELLRLPNKVAQLLLCFLWYAHIKQRTDDNLKSKIVHEWIHVNLFARGKFIEESIYGFFYDSKKCMNFINMETRLNQSPLLEPIVSVNGE